MAVADDAFSKIVKHSSFGNSFLCTHNSDNLSPKDFVLIDANKSNMTIAIVDLIEVVSAKSTISPVVFHPRLAVSKWIVPRPFLMGGVLGYNIAVNSNINIITYISVCYMIFQRA